MKPVLIMAWMTIRELFAEKLFFLLAAFALALVALGHLLGQMTYAEQSKLTVDFMLGAIEITMALFSIFMAQFLYQRELTSGSIYLILSKPISRTQYLSGKFLGQNAVQLAMLAMMYLMLLLSCSHFGEEFSKRATLQCLSLIAIQTMTLTAISYCFSIFSRGILPFLATFVLFLLGKFYPSLKQSLSAFSVLVPNFSILNTKALASYGLMITPAELSWLFTYAAVCTLFYLLLAITLFHRRDLQP